MAGFRLDSFVNTVPELDLEALGPALEPAVAALHVPVHPPLSLLFQITCIVINLTFVDFFQQHFQNFLFFSRLLGTRVLHVPSICFRYDFTGR